MNRDHARSISSVYDYGTEKRWTSNGGNRRKLLLGDVEAADRLAAVPWMRLRIPAPHSRISRRHRL